VASARHFWDVSRLTLLVSVVLATVFGCAGTGGSGGDVGKPPYPEGGRAEGVWLWEVGQGPAQTAKTCARGAQDPIARALCKTPAPTLGGLSDLYRVLRLGTFYTERLRAATTHSLGLGGRIVSGINPRVFVFRSYVEAGERGLLPDRIDAVAFSRGEQFVELVGFDQTKNDFNFYLLSFQQACNATRCTPRDLLTSKIEADWTGWTLYADTDLQDTGLDCLSCHRPDGESARKRLLMRQFEAPWMHWTDFTGVSALNCDLTTIPPEELDTTGATEIVVDGRGALLLIEGQPGQYAGVPLEELRSAASGHDFASFQILVARAFNPTLAELPDPTVGEPYPFDSLAVLCERLLRPSNPTAAWSHYRQQMATRGFPVPHHSPDVMDASKSADALADFGGFLERNADVDAFDLAAGLMSEDALQSVGFVPAATDAPDVVLRQMCVRCHNAATPAGLRRARFNAEALDALSVETIDDVRRRISMPRTSPLLMPPLRAGELPADVVQRVDAWLRDR
jgi:hypothetical protein